jgi:hypothetical protein
MACHVSLVEYDVDLAWFENGRIRGQKHGAKHGEPRTAVFALVQARSLRVETVSFPRPIVSIFVRLWRRAGIRHNN